MSTKFTKISAIILSMLLAAGCTATSEKVPSLPDDSSVSSPSYSDNTSTSDSSSSECSSLSEPEPESEPEPQPKTVNFAAVGDNLIHGAIYSQARTADGYDFSGKYANIADDIAAADVAIINQETLILNDAYPPSTWPCFNSPVALGDHMIDIGFDVFTIANNHCLDYGEAGLGLTLDYWESRDVLMAGVYHKGDDRIRLDEQNGIVFSYLSFTDNLNGLKQIPETQYEIGNANNLDEMITCIKTAKEVSDVCIVALHWGIEESTVITQGQRNIAQKLAEAGANIIIGTSPHVLRDIEMIHTEDHDTLCAYSLGNFISAQSAGRNMISGILNFNVTLNNGEAPAISNIRLTPIVTHYDWEYANVRIYKLSEYTEELAAVHGVNEFDDDFSYDYIVNFLKNVVDEQFLDL